MVLADADRRLIVAYLMNKMAPCKIVGPIAAAQVRHNPFPISARGSRQ